MFDVPSVLFWYLLVCCVYLYVCMYVSCHMCCFPVRKFSQPRREGYTPVDFLLFLFSMLNTHHTHHKHIHDITHMHTLHTL